MYLAEKALTFEHRRLFQHPSSNTVSRVFFELGQCGFCGVRATTIWVFRQCRGFCGFDQRQCGCRRSGFRQISGGRRKRTAISGRRMTKRSDQVWVLFGAVLIIMARSPDKIKSIEGSKETLKLSVRISDLWFIGTPNKSEQAEIVFVDFDYRVCDHQFKLVFIGVTVVRECILEDIPFRKYRFAGFVDVVVGQFEPGLLVDVIGVVEEVVFRQVSGKGRRFLKFLDDYEGDGPITVLLTHGGIKEAQGSYPPSVTNSFKASKLAELGIEAWSGFKSHGEGSTQLGGSIQLSSKESFFGKAEAKTIVEINTISEEIVCVTVGTITRIVLDNHSWCYTACIQCHKKSDAEMAPFTCACDKYNKEVVLRYRLEVMINHGDGNTKFLLWDRECSELISQSVDAVNKLKIKDGDVDLNVSPQALDKLLGYELAFKIKVQPKFRNSIVLKCSADSSLINVVMDMLADAETSSKMNISVSNSNRSAQHESARLQFLHLKIKNNMPLANEPAINREGYSDLGDQLMQCSHCNANTSPHNQIQEHIVSQLSEMLDEYNVHAKTFRMARDKFQDAQVDNIKLKLIANREKDGRTYNVPTVPEVAALIVGDFDANSKRDIIIETQHGQLQRIHELHSSYLALQYPLLFPYKEDEYRPDILYSSPPDGDYSNNLLLRGILWLNQKGFLTSETTKKKLRVDKFCSLQQSLDDGSTKGLNKGKRVILPSTFVGSPCYMDQLYFDGMAICSHVGFPNLFITLTCNPNWSEIHRLLNPLNLKATDRLDIISRVFKLKYEQMLMDLTKNHMLPHVHLLLFLHPDNKYPSSDEIDQIISAEIPSQQDDPELHSLVKNHMVHGPCGTLNPGSPCMKEGKCSRFYPKMFQPHIVLDADGFPVYHRRNNGHTIEKNGVIIDTSYIYLPDRYICPCESTWRIFGFPIHGRKPAVERLHFHLPGQHSVFYEDHDDIDDVLSKPSISDSKFISWMNTNQNSVEGRNLTYAEFVSKFVYNQKKRCWHLRKKGYTIGKLLWVPPITGELFYLRMMLTVCKGPTSFKDLRTIDNVQYPTYKEACFAMGFLQDDKEFIEAIKEAKD
ncbi:hypothetical protein HKD37_04G011085 [Glycine soja]